VFVSLIGERARVVFYERNLGDFDLNGKVQQHIITCHRIYDYQNPEHNPHYPIAPVADFYTALKYW